MALQKTLNTILGFPATYFKVTETRIEWLHKFAYVLLQGFKDKEARDTGKMPLTEMSYNYTAEDFPFSPTENVVTTAYELIKAEPQFSGAVDV